VARAIDHGILIIASGAAQSRLVTADLPTAWRTLRGIEAMERAGKGDVVAQVKFISKLFGLAA
jgi:hypothetical protein